MHKQITWETVGGNKTSKQNDTTFQQHKITAHNLWYLIIKHNCGNELYTELKIKNYTEKKTAGVKLSGNWDPTRLARAPTHNFHAPTHPATQQITTATILLLKCLTVIYFSVWMQNQ